jgi:hypothetical protein
MKTGRNDPCPCGSGKKYKKCCLARDQEAAAKQAADLPLPVPAGPPQGLPPPSAPRPGPAAAASPPAVPRDPLDVKREVRWADFEAQDTDGQITVFLAAVEDAELMDGDLAFAMLNRLHEDLVARGERARFADLVGTLRARRPEPFADRAAFCLAACLTDALADGKLDVVPGLARELGATAGANIDTVSRALDALAYHGQLAALLEAFRAGWPGVRDSANVLPWAIDDFAARGAVYEVFNYLEQTASPDPADPALTERIKFFLADPDPAYLPEFIADLTGKSGKTWKAEGFILKPPHQRRGQREDDKAANNLARLTCQFVGYLHYQEGVPFPRGQLVKPELIRYFLDRHAGELDPRPSLLEQARHPHKKLPPPPRPIHPLCPERVTLDAQLAGMLGMFNCLYHKAAALFLAIPAWWRFLESQQLLAAETHRKNLAELLPLHGQLLSLWKDFDEDPTLLRELAAWPADGAKGLGEGRG